MNNHFIIIGVLMTIIVGLQIAVFFLALKKIKLFKSVFPTIKKFKTVKLFIPENQINDLTLELIWANIETYSTSPIYDNNEKSIPSLSSHEIIDSMEKTKYVIIIRGEETKRINVNYFDNYNNAGWQFYKNDETSNSNGNNSPIKKKKLITVTKGPVTEQVGVELANIYLKAGWSIEENNK